MTRKLLLTAAIVALALTPSIGTGTAQARGFGGGGFGGGFHGGFGGGSHGGVGTAYGSGPECEHRHRAGCYSSRGDSVPLLRSSI